MTSLKERVKNDLSAAMRARDQLRKDALRMTLSAIRTAEVAGESARELTDDEIVTVLTREVKRRREAAEAFRSGGRTENADREDAEAAVISEYLPAQLSDEELAELVEQAVAEVGAESPRDMGKVMKTLQPKVAGRAEGRIVADAVKARLGS
ncbi:GatB/YqeY domain-containing protein [Actinobacteria bacterium YIM 96077]|uniref:GatB/YqeY domain-containing protein n=1 Tax=Phytoactinopolyspora halophila TaxID=1981511 RepID=A0A329R0S1_9ACTN|nr:GatB/YqeY domain-containing protein [Phytoactinopolyspora halophila]AYY11799.1 GatB/YqeY domain-containing protein [Actinobacteria bacterium YIM 96077]RAW17766.1 GatB/YqeY domain-containing protein [Phytoactinopolyspora halophila]